MPDGNPKSLRYKASQMSFYIQFLVETPVKQPAHSLLKLRAQLHGERSIPPGDRTFVYTHIKTKPKRRARFRAFRQGGRIESQDFRSRHIRCLNLNGCPKMASALGEFPILNLTAAGQRFLSHAQELQSQLKDYTCSFRKQRCYVSRFKLELPPDLDRLLSEDPSLRSAVDAAREDFGVILWADRRPFFPEYTDHGLQHVEHVLRTAHALARDDARALFSAQDAAVLTISTVLHDVAMQIEEHAFAALVQGQLPHRSIPWFSHHHHEKAWPVLWDEFRSEAARFSGRKNLDLFNSPEPVSPPNLARPEEWTRNQRLLIGEFLRRHHGRLAHEIAIHGFPAPVDLPSTGTSDVSASGGARDGISGVLHLANRLHLPLRDLAGLVARSHAISLRPCLDYLYDTYQDKRTPHRCHAIFLMTLLRLADYLQIESGRAPRQLLEVTKLQSPLSAGEWRKHEAIQHVYNTGDDREALHILARPADVTTFLGLKQLLIGLQRELDHSWAILGEVYGPVPSLHALGLTIRRIYSNLDDKHAFASTVSYIPEHVSFVAASAEVLKLLIGPLYADRPEIGVRELLQNAVDAVLELQDFLSRRPERREEVLAQLHEQSSDIVIALESESDSRGITQHWLRVTDKGKGMNAYIVQQYFLAAGASFRMSDAWRKENLDESGRSRILRSGRFGIGVLAAFLLGNRIQVRTRHVEELRGIQFDAELNTPAIELKVIEGLPIGTTVRVLIAENDYKEWSVRIVEWNWFYLNQPSVLRTIQMLDMVHKLERFIPSLGEKRAGWFRIRFDGYAELQWTYREVSTLFCNGFVIPDARYSSETFATEDKRTVVKVPKVSVFDPNGHLPLTLDRLSLRSKRLPFERALYHDVLLNIIAYAVTTAPDGRITDSSQRKWYFNHGGHPGLNQYGQQSLWFSTESGVAFADPQIIRLVSPETILFLVVLLSPDILGTAQACRFDVHHSHAAFSCQDAQIELGVGGMRDGFQDAIGVAVQGGNLFAEIREIQVFIGSGHKRKSGQFQLPGRRLEVKHTKGGLLYTSGPESAFSLHLPQLVNDIDVVMLEKMVIAELVGAIPQQSPESLLGELWHRYIGTVIPFDPIERRALRDKLHVLSEMRPHLDYWESAQK